MGHDVGGRPTKEEPPSSRLTCRRARDLSAFNGYKRHIGLNSGVFEYSALMWCQRRNASRHHVEHPVEVAKVSTSSILLMMFIFPLLQYSCRSQVHRQDGSHLGAGRCSGEYTGCFMQAPCARCLSAEAF